MSNANIDASHPTASASHLTASQGQPQDALTRRHLWQLGAAAVLASGAASILPKHNAAAAAATGKTAQDYFTLATKLAGDNPILTSMVGALTAGYVPPRPPAPASMMIFDNVAALSVGWVSAMAIRTSEGIILIDALTTPDDAERIIAPGLEALGADPSTVKYIVVAHAHGDHFGGANYFVERYGSRVMMAPADWDFLAASGQANKPARDLDIADGQKLTLGDTTVSLHHTPGHTPGTISPIFPARWRGRTHTAMLWGGTNPPTPTASKETYLSSVLSFASRMRQAGVDVELSNHGFSDYGLERVELLRSAAAGDPNPFIVGTAEAQRFMKVIETMLRGRIAADQEATPATTVAAVVAAPLAAESPCC